jgi:hypothetical protein
MNDFKEHLELEAKQLVDTQLKSEHKNGLIRESYALIFETVQKNS